MKWAARYAVLHLMLLIWPTRTLIRRRNTYDDMHEVEPPKDA
jgi:hypothetical protein